MKIRKIISLLLAMMMALSFNVVTYASGIVIEEDDNVEIINGNEEAIQKLLDDRASLLNKILITNGDDNEKEKYVASLNAIDLELVRLGATFLTAEEVAAQFPETKNNKEFALLGQTQVVNPNVSTPSSSVNTWVSYRTTVTSGGVSYNIQRLVAQPKNASSPLVEDASRIVRYSKNYKAGVANVLETLAESSIGSIPKASKYVTFYSALKAFASGISTTTEVQAPEVTYTWAGTTTAVFTYVRKTSQTDDYQWLSLISTKNYMEVGYSMSKFSYKLSNGSWQLVPSVVQDVNVIDSTPTGYDDNSVALAAYNSVSGGPVHRAVSYVQISGPESTSVQKVSICYPNFPAHCE